MNPIQNRYILNKPIAYLICNFLKSSKNLLNFDEIQTLFHEMGHALHLLLSEIDHFIVSGIDNIEWDAIELPSQFMEYFTWNYEILKLISKKDNIISKSLYDKLIMSRHFQTGLNLLKQIEYALFDFLLHLNKKSNYLKLLKQIRNEIAIIIPPKYNYFPNTFSHIFAGGYAAGYYSYKWAEVLACDIFSKFDNLSINEYSKVGQKFLISFLSKGSLNSANQNFKAFMNREPNENNLLKYLGIKKP